MQTQTHTTRDAAGLKAHLELLEIERAAAGLHGMSSDGPFMADLLEELAAIRSAYVGAAVTEIASLRAALNTPLVG